MPSRDPLTSLAPIIVQPARLRAEDVPLVVAAGLGGAVRVRLPQRHPQAAALRPAHLALAQRHAQIRAELRPLLAAWAREGIQPLLFKGFALAEFVYGVDGERFYGDVDALLPEDPALVMRAAHIALAHGWHSDGQHAAPATWTHETMHLIGPGRSARLDVHRYVTGMGGGRSN